VIGGFITFALLARLMHARRGLIVATTFAVLQVSYCLLITSPASLGRLVNMLGYTWTPALAIVLLVRAVRERRAARIRPPWLCQACDYDRQGVPADTPCPECGAAAPGAVVEAT
jgi:hypothetical protein